VEHKFFSVFSWLLTAGASITVALHSKLQPAVTSIFLQQTEQSTLISDNIFTYLSSVKGGRLAS